jgi:hypothetical protein
MFDINIIAGLSIIVVNGIFIVWFFGKLTKNVTTQ